MKTDLAVIGAGISGAFTLIELLDRLDVEAIGRPLDIAVFDPGAEFFSGIPYGPRSGHSSLIITPLNEFLGGEELEQFKRWIAANADNLLKELRDNEGIRTQAWLENAEDAVRTGECDHLHVPRFFFGRYVNDLMDEARARAGDSVRFHLFPTEADGISRDDVTGDFQITSSDETVTARACLLTAGMPPTKRLFDDAPETEALLIEDPYTPSLDATLDLLTEHVLSVEEETAHIAVIGANAGSLEMLYLIDDRPELREKSLTITVVSPQGQLPERFMAGATSTFEPTNLIGLEQQDAVEADAILKAVAMDVEHGRGQGFNISERLPVISAAVGRLLPRLSEEQMEAFVTFPGIEIGRLQRRAGQAYCDAADALRDAGRMTVTSGKYQGVSPAAADTVAVECTTDTNETFNLEGPAHVVVNCAGSSGLRRPNYSRFLESAMEAGICWANPSGFGLDVDDNFQATEGLFVHGPLLAGNVVNGTGIWHVEHAGRIIGFAPTVAEHVHALLVDDAPE